MHVLSKERTTSRPVHIDALTFFHENVPFCLLSRLPGERGVFFDDRKEKGASLDMRAADKQRKEISAKLGVEVRKTIV